MANKFKDPLVIGLTGEIGAGKTTLAEYLKFKHGFKTLRYSKIIQDLYHCDGKRDTLQQVGQEIASNPDRQKGLSLEAIRQINNNPNSNFVIDGLRHLLDYETLLDHFGERFILIYNNLTDNTYELYYNEPLISIEFTKINPYKSSSYKETLPEEFQKTKNFSERTVENYINEALKNSQGVTSEDFGVVNSVPAIKDAIGSIEGEQNKLNEFKNETTETVNSHKREVEQTLDKSKKYSIIGAIITIILTLAGLFIPIIIQLDAIQKERSEYNREIIYLQENLKSSQDDLSELLMKYENLLKTSELDATEIEALKIQIEELNKEITELQFQLENLVIFDNNE